MPCLTSKLAGSRPSGGGGSARFWTTTRRGPRPCGCRGPVVGEGIPWRRGSMKPCMGWSSWQRPLGWRRSAGFASCARRSRSPWTWPFTPSTPPGRVWLELRVAHWDLLRILRQRCTALAARSQALLVSLSVKRLEWRKEWRGVWGSSHRPGRRSRRRLPRPRHRLPRLSRGLAGSASSRTPRMLSSAGIVRVPAPTRRS
mmetsp:Transcript_36908/g.96560  ORF Transcript_36908/g.96560 Transcript_36908/m.96560 type:complete len:200 (-) Transcript_36908:340-939(-)